MRLSPIGLAAAAWILLFPAMVYSAETIVPPTLPPEKWEKLPPHPRLYADAARFEALKTQKDDISVALRALLRSAAEEKLAAAPIVYPAEGIRLEAMREVEGRIMTLAMQYRLSGDRRYFERARQELLELAALPTWFPGHFLDTAEAALAAGVGLDWLYDELTPEERGQIETAIRQNALVLSLEVTPESRSWLNADFNWNQVCNAGLTVGALAVYERDPKLARQVLERAITSLPYAGAVYAPDGAYAEGPSYWAYGTSFHILMTEALRSAFGTTLDLDNPPGFLKSADFMAQMKTPTGGEFGYADYNDHETRSFSEPVLLWFARQRKSRAAAGDELQNIVQLATNLHKNGKTPKLSRLLAMELLWWNPELPPVDSALPLHWTAGGHVSLAVLRSAWNDPNATYLALKGGTPDGSHAHMDIGSFILEMYGVRWALDLGAESYDRMRAAKIDLWNYSQNSTRWTTFRAGPEAHNILRFDSARQNVEGHAIIQALPDEDGTKGDLMDLSSLYAEQVAQVRRTARLHPNRSVTMDDEWTAADRAVTATWQWLTKAKVTRTNTGLLLEQSGKSLTLTVDLPQIDGTKIEVQDLSEAQAPQDSPNPGLSRILITIPTAANSTVRLKITAH